MKIEPCLYCGDNLKELVSWDAQCLGCGAIVEYCNIPLHNRLSRIVRAAEKWAKARRTGTLPEISETGNELLLAVEGGAE